MSSPAHVLLTGASGSLGRALALEFAASGTLLSLTGREESRLQETAALCSHKGATTHATVLDIRERDALASWVLSRDACKPVDVVIANAGVSASIQPDGRGEHLEDVRRLFAVNTLGVVETVTHLAERMRQRRSGQIVIIGSLAGLRGLPASPAYCASKAGAMVYGDALRAWLAPYGVRVNVVAMGFVDSAMSRRYLGDKPLLCSAEKGARLIRQGMERNRPCIMFPLALGVGQRLLSFLPRGVGDAIQRRFFPFVVAPDNDSSCNKDRAS